MISIVGALAACGTDAVPPLETAAPGVIFTYPVDGQLDVPLGARIVATFSDDVVPGSLGACSGSAPAISGAFCLVGPSGPLDTMAEVVGTKTVVFAAAELDPGTPYELYVQSAISPSATNLPASGPLLRFTTRAAQPSSRGPAVIAVNGADPTHLMDRPMYETTTIRLVFSEPLDPRTVALAQGSIELVDVASGEAVPARLVTKGIHVSLDPIDDLTAGASYEVRLGNKLADLSGRALTPIAFTLVPTNSLGTGAIPQILRTRQPGDPGPASSRSGAKPNVIVISKPLIGDESVTLQPGAIHAELGDPTALDGPIAFTIRRGARLGASGLDVKLGGTIPAGLRTGDVQIEFLTDGGGRLYRNRYQPAEQTPDNTRAPLYVDLTFDVAISAIDPTGNAAVAQTVLNVQATGTAIATDGVLAIEAVAAMDFDLLGVTEAPTNLVFELIVDPTATVPTDTTPPVLVAS